MTQYQPLINKLLGIGEVSKVEDFWVKQSKIPLFSKRTFRNYEKGIVPIEDVITVDIDTRDAQSRNPFNALVCASTGIGKTRLVKNIVKGFHQAGYKILFIEPKSVEMYNARKIGKSTRIHHLDKNTKLPVVSYCPRYAQHSVRQNFAYMDREVKYYSPDIRILNNPEIWHSFGISDKAAHMIVRAIEKGHTDIDSFIDIITNSEAMPNTKKAAIATLENLKGTGFFGTNQRLELEKEWDKNNIVVVNYFSRSGTFMNTDIGLVIDQVRDIGQKESEGGLNLSNVKKKLIIFDDAFYYAGRNASAMNSQAGNANFAILNIENCQNNFRTWGIDTMFIVQSPDSAAIQQSLIDGCTTKLIGYTENVSALSGKLPASAYRLIYNTDPMKGPMLYTDEDNYVFQWIYVRGKTRWETGYPFDCSVGHS